MLSLILTALLGLFCYSGSIDNRLSEVSTDSNIIVNATESFVCEDFRSSSVSKDAVFLDETFYYLPAVFYTSQQFYDNLYDWLVEYDGIYYWSYDNTTSQNKTWVFNGDVRFTNHLTHRVFRSWYEFPVDSIQVTRSHYISNNEDSDTNSRIYWDVWTYGIYFNMKGGTTLDDIPIIDISCVFNVYNNFHYFSYDNFDRSTYMVIPGTIMAHTTYGQPVSDYNWSGLDLRLLYDETTAPFNMRDVLLGKFFTGGDYDLAYSNGYTAGFDEGNQVGYQTGYAEGYQEGADVDATASTIFTGILDVALIPVNVFLTIFNFEVFGINIAGIVGGLLTISVVIIILRFVFGGKKDD